MGQLFSQSESVEDDTGPAKGRVGPRGINGRKGPAGVRGTTTEPVRGRPGIETPWLDEHPLALVKYDPNVCSPETYLLYIRLARVAAGVFRKEYTRILDSNTPMEQRLQLYELHWNEFEETKRFLDENLGNLDSLT
jgi:hypothetical protein